MLSRVMALCILSAICVPALAQGELAELKKLRALCGHEIRTLCKGVEPGGGRIKACLKKNADNLTVGCAKALLKLKEEMKK
jgi:hypothetical protein